MSKAKDKHDEPSYTVPVREVHRQIPIPWETRDDQGNQMDEVFYCELAAMGPNDTEYKLFGDPVPFPVETFDLGLTDDGPWRFKIRFANNCGVYSPWSPAFADFIDARPPKAPSASVCLPVPQRDPAHPSTSHRH